MINFRFHIISIVAVFLALGIGIIMGSTVIDRAIVDGLRSRIDVAEANSVKRKVNNDKLNAEAKVISEQDTILAGHSVRDYLKNQTVYILVVGDVSNEVTTEVLELSTLAGGQVSSVIRFNDGFIKEDKTDLLNKYSSTTEDAQPINSEVDSGKLMLNYFQNSLNTKREGNKDLLNGALNYESFLSFLQNETSFKESNIFVNPIMSQNVSFMVLVNRADLKDNKYVSFIGNLQNSFPITIGLSGNPEGNTKISVVDSVKKIKKVIDEPALVDNIDTPSGRTSFVITHKDNIAGKKSIYGESSESKDRAPALN